MLQICEKLSQDFIPTRKPFKKSKKSSRIPRDRRILMRRRSKIEKKYILSKNSIQTKKLHSQLIEIEKQLQLSHRKSASDEEKKVTEAIKVNPKYFYSYAKRHGKTKTKIGPLKDKNSFTTDSKKMADILQKQYQSVFSNPIQEDDINFEDNKT